MSRETHDIEEEHIDYRQIIAKAGYCHTKKVNMIYQLKQT